MSERLEPRSEAEVAALVREAREAKRPLFVEGGGTRRGLGRPVQAARGVSLRALSGIVAYEPSEMVITARAGTPLEEIEAALAEKGQMLPFEPLDHRALFGSEGAPTIGAVAACNLSGPRRIQAGAARDALIGLRLVNGRGEIVKSGGRVMKNVTGLDLVKLNCGAMGTLGALTEVTFKLLPRPERSATISLQGLDDARAVAALSAALGSPFEASAAAHVPAHAGEPARTLVRLENLATSIPHRVDEMKKVLAPFGRPMQLNEDLADHIWRDIRDARFFAGDARAVWRVSLAPSRAPGFVASVAASLSCGHCLDWGGGLVWLACDAAGDGGAAAIRRALDGRGHATLVRAPDALRASLDVFEPLAAPLMKISAGVKASFDPAGLLNPGRMYAGV